MDFSGINFSIPFNFGSFSGSGFTISTSVESHLKQTIQQTQNNYVAAMMLMTEQLSAMTMQSSFSIGSFLDAKQQLEAQRKHQELKARAIKDYHPSEEMCRVGSYMRTIATAEQKSENDARMMGERLINIYMAEKNSTTMINNVSYTQARLDQFRKVYCDPQDNNNALQFMCDHDQDSGGLSGGQDPMRLNKDIDVARTLEAPKTLEIDFSNDNLETDEEDILALASNLYWPKALRWNPDNADISKRNNAMRKARRLIALNTVAHNSFTNYAALKAKSPEPATGQEPGWSFMKTFIKEFGLTEAEIDEWMGEHPSYWAQMEVLTKKMLQHPNFYTNLYDKPVNVDRMSVALEAISLMQLRDQYDSSLRAELIKSAMIETELEKDFNQVQLCLMTDGCK